MREEIGWGLFLAISPFWGPRKGKGPNSSALSRGRFDQSPNLFPSRQGHQAPEGLCQHSAPGPAVCTSTCPGKTAHLDPRPCGGQSRLWPRLCCFAEGQSCLSLLSKLPTDTSIWCFMVLPYLLSFIMRSLASPKEYPHLSGMQTRPLLQSPGHQDPGIGVGANW